VKLVDLGIAKIGEASQLTGFVAMGTLEYMPPEQFDGPDVTPLADVYALGIVLLECALGAHPAPPVGGDEREALVRWRDYHKQRDVVTADARRRLGDSAAAIAPGDLLPAMAAK